MDISISWWSVAVKRLATFTVNAMPEALTAQAVAPEAAARMVAQAESMQLTLAQHEATGNPALVKILGDQSLILYGFWRDRQSALTKKSRDELLSIAGMFDLASGKAHNPGN